MNKKVSLTASQEWDFRQVDPKLLREAAIYEYARTSDKIRELIVSWLDAVVQRKKIRRHIFEAIQSANKKDGDPADFLPDGLWNKFTLSWPLPGDFGREINSIIMDLRPDFPSPWITEGVKVNCAFNSEFSRVSCSPLYHTFASLAQREFAGMSLKRMLEIQTQLAKESGSYRLKIDWFADGLLSSKEEILSDFERWLTAEIERTQPKMRTGRNSQADQAAYPLKCLAALRLRRAGFTYGAAANGLEYLQSASWIIPWFKNSSSWSRAITAAEGFLANIEAGKVDF